MHHAAVSRGTFATGWTSWFECCVTAVPAWLWHRDRHRHRDRAEDSVHHAIALRGTIATS